MEKLQNLLKGVHTAAIAGHVNPDGDCIGSCLAMYNYLTDTYPEIELDLYMEAIPEVYGFLKNAQKAQSVIREGKKYDLLIALDSANPERIGVASSLCTEADAVLNVDHHISNPNYGNVNIVYPNASSASEIVYEMILADDGNVDMHIAEAIYLGMMQDTGVFKYSNTSARTMAIAGQLMDTGINFSEIVDKTFFEKTYEQARILGAALVNSVLTDDGSCIVSVITLEDKMTYGAQDSDMDGISSQLVNTKDVDAAVFIREIREGVYKASLRSKTDRVDVNRTASLYGGGGHKRAAGCTITGDLSEAVYRLTQDIQQQSGDR